MVSSWQETVLGKGRGALSVERGAWAERKACMFSRSGIR